MLFMKSQSHIWPFFRSHYLIKKNYLIKIKIKSILQCIWNGESIGIWNQRLKKKKKTLKLDTWRKIRQQLESNLESN